jgi:hypothetical protein
MNNFLGGMVIFVVVLILMPGITFSLLAAIAVSPHISILAIIALSIGFGFVFFVFARENIVIGSSESERLKETEEFHRQLSTVLSEDYLHNIVYPHGKTYKICNNHKDYEAYILDNNSVLLSKLGSKKTKVITLRDLRNLRAAENTVIRKKMNAKRRRFM